MSLKKNVVIIGVVSLAVGFILGYTADRPSEYPLILYPNKLVDADISSTSYMEDNNSITLSSLGSDPTASIYTYANLSVSCDDINVYKTDSANPENQVLVDTIRGQDVECNQSGAFINYELESEDTQLTFSSDSNFTFASYQALESESD